MEYDAFWKFKSRKRLSQRVQRELYLESYVGGYQTRMDVCPGKYTFLSNINIQ